MKKFIFLLGGLLLGIAPSQANNDSLKIADSNCTTSINNNGTQIFVENNIEFALFTNGEFDFLIKSQKQKELTRAAEAEKNLSFNAGYNYNARVQYDAYGAVIQVENTPIFYDDYGRVNQIGKIEINYNAYGTVHQVGDLYLRYNQNNNRILTSGYINNVNRAYFYRVWHSYFRVPHKNFCVIYDRPYRKSYSPKRFVFNGDFSNNTRQASAVASRKNKRIKRNKALATKGKGLEIADYSIKYPRTKTEVKKVNSKKIGVENKKFKTKSKSPKNEAIKLPNSTIKTRNKAPKLNSKKSLNTIDNL